jgi:hypothetical protein
MARVVKHLTGKCKALSSNFSTTKEKKKISKQLDDAVNRHLRTNF